MGAVENNVPELRFPGFEGEWKLVNLGSLSTLITSGSRDWAQYYSMVGNKFIRMTNLPKKGIQLLLDDLKYVELPESGSEGARTSLKSKDILISITAELGKIGLIPDDFGVAYINQHTALVRLNNEACPEYVAHHLSSTKSNKKINRLNDSGAKSGLNLNTIRGFKIDLPSLSEQQKIATFLGAVDDKLTVLRRKRELLQDYKRGMMQKIFSRELRFKREDGSDFPDWVERRLGEVMVLSSGTSKSKLIDPNGNRFIIDMGAISSEGQLIPSKRTHYDQDYLATGQLVMPKDDIGAGKIIGRVARIDKDDTYILGDHVYLLNIHSCNSMFLNYLINSCEINKCFRRKANGTAQLGLGRKAVLQQTIILPASEREQQKIADFLSAIDSKIEAVGKQVEQVETFKKGLLQKMFV